MAGPTNRLLSEPIEPRILHSADLAPLAWSAPSALHAGSTSAPLHAAVQPHEIVFVDAMLNDAQGLIADLQAQRDAGRRIEIVTIDIGSDGLALIGDTLAARRDIGAVHLLAHGSEGRLQLGTGVLDAQTLLQRAGEVAAWGQALSADADLLIYGCDLAQGADGQRLVQDLAALTGADVAASIDPTGAEARGANWTLEFATGRIEAALAPSRWEQALWQGAMATYTVTTTIDVTGAVLLPGTLRWAIAQANANPGVDTIVFAVNGTFSIAALTSGGDDNKGGDFDITDSVNIIGNGSANTIIAGNGLDRVFDVRSGSVTFTGLTIQGGASNAGAGVRIDSSAAVTLVDAVVQNNVGNGASKGGGILNDGTLTLRRTIVQDNGDAGSNEVDGAGIYNKGTLDARDVEIRGNLASGNKDGGGLFIEKGDVTLQNVTLAGNQAKRGAGIFNSGDGTNTLSNVTIAGNTATAQGGGLWSDKTLAIDHVTFAYNTATAGGGVFVNAQNVTAQNSLFVGNSGGNTNKALASAGYNLSDDNSAGFNATGDLRNVSAGAGALAANGGFTRTVSIGAGSAARDAANPASTVAADQRGLPTDGARRDIGAYEYSPYGYAPTISALPSQTIDEDQTLGPVAFTIGDPETGAGSLVLSATSSNGALVPNANIVLGGSGANRTISLTPALNANSAANGGPVTITVTVSDGGNSTSTSFVVTVQAANDAPTGSVTITGTPTQGQTLSATHSLADADGLGTIGYQWRADGVAIAGATGATLLLGQAQVGKAITVTASYTDGGGTAESVTSAATAAVANINDAPIGSVTIAGTATNGATLTVHAALTDADGLGTIGYQWRADGVDIVGATGGSLTLGPAQVGARITVTASYTDGFGTSESATSAATAPVTANNSDPTGGVTISGTPMQGQTLTATHALADADGLGPIDHQWFADGVAIAGATGATLLLDQAQVGLAITVVASYTDGGGTLEAVSSAPTAAVSNVNDAPSGSVTITGTPAQGQTLSATHSLGDADGLGTIGYQWFADGVAIGGATADSLVLAQAHVGKAISVAAGYVDGHGTTESVSSAATAPVANANDAPTGGVTIVGDPTQGQVLAAVHTLADADGLGPIAYQWFAGGAAIAGATGSTLVLGQAQVGQVITVSASYIDGHGTAEGVTSAATAAVANVNDAPAGSVTITGTAAQGETLTAAHTLSDADGLGTIHYQWLADGAAISGATGATLVLGQAQVGQAITVIASYTDGDDTIEAVASAPTAAVANANDAPTGSVTISGTPTQGRTLSAGHSLGDIDGLGTISYQWRADGSAIAGATGATLVLGQAQVGKVITVTASYIDGHGSAESVTSMPSATVANINDAPLLARPLADASTAQGSAFVLALPADTFSDVDAGDALTYSATLASGAALPPWLQFDAATRTFSGTPVRSDVGAIALRVVAADGGGASASADFVLTVVDANHAPVLATPIADQNATAGSSVRFVLPPAAFADPDVGDALTYHASLADGSALPHWISFDAAQRTFTASPGAGDLGSVLVRVVAADAAGATAQALFAFVVVAPPPQAPLPVAAGVPAVDLPDAPASTPDTPPPVARSNPAPATAASQPAIAHLEAVSMRASEIAWAELSIGSPVERSRGSMPAAAATVRPAGRSDALLGAALLGPYSDLAAAPLMQWLRGDDLLRRLDELQRQMSDADAQRRAVVASSAAIASGLSVGYVVWLVRGGVLASSMLSALPAWQMIDPLPVLAGAGRRRQHGPGADEPEVERLFDAQRRPVARPAAPTRAAIATADAAARHDRHTTQVHR